MKINTKKHKVSYNVYKKLNKLMKILQEKDLAKLYAVKFNKEVVATAFFINYCQYVNYSRTANL